MATFKPRTREQLKGQQVKGTWSVKPELTNEKWAENGAQGFNVVSDTGEDVIGTIGLLGHNEADAALIAEAGNVANRTGMWPEDMEKRIKELEKTLRWLDNWMGDKSLKECAEQVSMVIKRK